MANNSDNTKSTISKADLIRLLQEADQLFSHEQLDQAYKAYTKVLRFTTDIAEIHHKLGSIAYKQGNIGDALKHFTDALNLDGNNTTYHANAATAYYQLYKLDKKNNSQFSNLALHHFSQAIKLDASNVQAYNNMASLLIDTGKNDDALVLLTKAIELKPDNAMAHNNIGNLYKNIEKLHLAVQHYEKAIELDPKYDTAYNNLGTVYNVLGYYDRAAICFVKAIQINPDFFEVYSNYSDVLKKQGKLEAAKGAYTVALKLQPDNVAMKWNLGILELSVGNLEKGWQLYEYGLETGSRQPDDFGLPIWKGEDLTDKSIVLCREQGIGDEILFSSCFNDIISKAKNTTITCDARLEKIFTHSFPDCEIIATKIKNTPIEFNKGKINNSDFQIGAGSLPKFFRNNISDFPERRSYLLPNQDSAQYWKQHLDSISPKLKIGLAWRSGVMTPERALQYLSIEDISPLFDIKEIDFVHLQYDDCQKELDYAKSEYGIDIISPENIDMFNDFDGLSGLLSSLDIVIGIGTANLSLAAAMGTECYKLSLPFQWNMLGTRYYPWQPAITCFIRSAPSSWETEINAIKEKILEKLNG